MPKMTPAQLKAVLGAQYTAANAADNASKLSSDRTKALNYYNGDVSQDMPSAPGRSSAVSMDVSDTIEGLMPQLMEIFCGGESVVEFLPVGPEDVKPAQQETDYVNHVFMQRNPGFLVLYSFCKDALLSKTGIVKVWAEEEIKDERETYLDKSPDEYALLAGQDDVKILAHSEHDGLHDVVLQTSKKKKFVRVLGVPPEEFGVESGARAIRTANYCFHRVVDKTEADLIALGYDAQQVKRIPTYRPWVTTEAQSRDTVGESDTQREQGNSASRLVEVVEHYSRLDYEGDGNPQLYKITTAGRNGEVLRLKGKADIVPFDAIPFAVMTPIIVTHRLIGRSIADLVMDIQRIKTALWRGALDNLYVSNNPRVVVSEAHASENTLDDLLVSRPNQIVRVKQPGGLEYQTSPDITGSVYPALEYMDQRLETRTGFSKRGQGIDPDALSNQSATAAKIVENASQARVRLIARIFAETGISDLFWLLHATIKKHADKAEVVKLRNAWIPVDPREWKTREDLTVKVGLGSGGRAQEVAELNLIATKQAEALAAGLTNLVTVENLYNTAQALCRAMGKPDVSAFFTDPATQPPLQPRPDPKLLELQGKAQIEQLQAQADVATQDRKTAAEIALAEKKFEFEKRLALMEMEMKREEHQMNMVKSQHEASIKEALANHSAGLKQQEVAATTAPHQNLIDMVSQLHQHSQHMHERMTQMEADNAAPVEFIRDKNGKLAGAKKGSKTIMISRGTEAVN